MAKSRTSFRPGMSGNPGGRPKAALDMQELARAHTPDAIAALVAALANPRERVSAAVALLDRGWGKPVQALAGDSSAPPVVVEFRWADATPQPAPSLRQSSTPATWMWCSLTRADGRLEATGDGPMRSSAGCRRANARCSALGSVH
jgi:hypothetical protein